MQLWLQFRWSTSIKMNGMCLIFPRNSCRNDSILFRFVAKHYDCRAGFDKTKDIYTISFLYHRWMGLILLWYFHLDSPPNHGSRTRNSGRKTREILGHRDTGFMPPIAHSTAESWNSFRIRLVIPAEVCSARAKAFKSVGKSSMPWPLNSYSMYGTMARDSAY